MRRRSGALWCLGVLGSPLWALVTAAPAVADPKDTATDPSEPAAERFEHPESRAGRPGPPVHTSICLALPRYEHLPERSGSELVRQVATTRIPPGSLYIDYDGLHRYVARRVRSRFRSLWGDHLSRLWRETHIRDYELRRLHRRMGFAKSDLVRGGRWWERSWLDSLPAPKGGAPERAIRRQYGKELTIFEWGPLEVDNELHARIDEVAVIGLDPDPSRIYRDLGSLHETDARTARDDAHLERAVLDPTVQQEERAARERRARSPTFVPFPELGVDLDLPRPKRRFLENTRWSFGFKPHLSMSPHRSVDLREWVNEFSVEADLDVYLGEDELKIVSFEVEVSYEPDDRELTAVFDLALVAW